MKILILANDSGGLYSFRKELIQELSKENELYAAVPFATHVQGLQKLELQLIECDVDRRGINPRKDLILLKKYNRILKDLNPDLVITYTIKPNIYGGIAARLNNKQYAINITGLGTAFENHGLIRRVVVNLYKFVLKKAKVIYFENSGNRDVLVSFRCCKSEQTVVLQGAGVNTEYYSYQPYPQNDMFKFLFVGRVMKEKGIGELFESMQKLTTDGNKCFLDVVGPFEEEYNDTLKQYESKGWLKYHGYQEDVKPFIAACDCFVLPSYHEGMANTNLECASSGRPIITSNIPGCKEAVIEEVSGFLCEPREVGSLYEVMKKMVGMTREAREKMGRAGRRHMEEKFDKRKVVEETLKHL